MSLMDNRLHSSLQVMVCWHLKCSSLYSYGALLLSSVLTVKDKHSLRDRNELVQCTTLLVCESMSQEIKKTSSPRVGASRRFISDSSKALCFVLSHHTTRTVIELYSRHLFQEIVWYFQCWTAEFGYYPCHPSMKNCWCFADKLN